jgi:TetR/AcrR family transcriptional repressor of nem operon|tara:strand:- start:1333 stop:1878 length:546 start_codon:yes stop_codon:yes gene_type:complete
MSNLTKIQDIAEHKIRIGGFNSFSFREIADEVGIKSSSVHYHFPTKLDLGLAVAKRYTDRFIDELKGHEDASLSLQLCIEMYIRVFETALKRDRKMCLCGLLAAESSNLPNALKSEARRFFQLNIEWLTNKFVELGHLDENSAKAKAIFYISSLEGALLTSQVNDDTTIFDATAKQLKALL